MPNLRIRDGGREYTFQIEGEGATIGVEGTRIGGPDGDLPGGTPTFKVSRQQLMKHPG